MVPSAFPSAGTKRQGSGIAHMLEPAVIREGLARLSEIDRGLTVFGALAHGYQLNPRLPERKARAFEVRQGLCLPPDYRLFLTELGNGGAGPYYGVDRLGEFEGERWHPQSGLIGDLAAPFTHEGPWNVPESTWEGEPDLDLNTATDEDLRRAEEWEHWWQYGYCDPHLMNGAIPICHLGCGQAHYLVVSGPRAGEMWADLRVDREGIRPVTGAAGATMDFAAWYMAWLEDAPNRLGTGAPLLGCFGPPRRSWLDRLLGR